MGNLLYFFLILTACSKFKISIAVKLQCMQTRCMHVYICYTFTKKNRMKFDETLRYYTTFIIIIKNITVYHDADNTTWPNNNSGILKVVEY